MCVSVCTHMPKEKRLCQTPTLQVFRTPLDCSFLDASLCWPIEEQIAPATVITQRPRLLAISQQTVYKSKMNVLSWEILTAQIVPLLYFAGAMAASVSSITFLACPLPRHLSHRTPRCSACGNLSSAGPWGDFEEHAAQVAVYGYHPFLRWRYRSIPGARVYNVMLVLIPSRLVFARSCQSCGAFQQRLLYRTAAKVVDRQLGRDYPTLLCNVLPEIRTQVRQGLEGAHYKAHLY